MKKNNLIYMMSLLLMFCILSYPAKIQGAVSNEIEINTGSTKGEAALIYGDSGQTGSIEIQLEDTGQNLSKENVKLGIIQVADVLGGKFVVRQEFEDIHLDLNTIQNANELELAAQTIASELNEVDEYIVTDETGNALLENLEIGVYLIVALDTAGYENITPCLVSIPTFDETEQSMKYDVKVYPKHAPKPIPEVPNIIPTGVNDMAGEYGIISVILLILSSVLGVVTVKYRKFLTRGSL